LGSISPSTSVSLANFVSTNFSTSTIIIIIQGRYNTSNSGLKESPRSKNKQNKIELKLTYVFPVGDYITVQNLVLIRFISFANTAFKIPTHGMRPFALHSCRSRISSSLGKKFLLYNTSLF
jgi:hypothetical protein